MDTIETVIIGAGQAGLSTGYHLRRKDRPFVILDAAARVGDQWRQLWDSLELYSPTKYDGLPGMPFPGDPWSFPSKDRVADYLEQYAAQFRFPIRSHTRVERLEADGTADTSSPRTRASSAARTSSCAPEHSDGRRACPSSQVTSTRRSCSCTRVSIAGPASFATARSSSSAPHTRAPTSPTRWRRPTRRSWPVATAARSPHASRPGRCGSSSRC